MHTRLAIAAVVLAACQPQGTAVPVERLELPAEVALVDAVVGGASQVAIEIRNVGAAGAEIDLSVDPPFFVSTPGVFVPAGGTVRVRVGVRGEDYAPVTGFLEVSGPFATFAVPVSAAFDSDHDGDGSEAVAAGGDDCDDSEFGVHPGADEVCNGRDDDCDSDIDVDPVGAPEWYRDADGDRYGSDEIAASCSQPAGFVMLGGDCDDSDASVRPGVSEVFYDGVDQDCSGDSDFDRDGDGFDHSLFGGTDCRDLSPSIHPGAAELDDLVDQDCDKLVDEDFLAHGDVVVTEVLVLPTYRDAEDGQYVEIVNAAPGRILNLRGMVVATDAGDTELGSVTLAPGAVALLCANPSSASNGGLSCAGTLPGLLGAHDWIRVSSADVLDELDWTSEDWKMMPGQSLELTDIDADANDDVDSWCQAVAPVATTDTGLDTGDDTGTEPVPTEPTDSGSPGNAEATCKP